jgi:hypothetical protein
MEEAECPQWVEGGRSAEGPLWVDSGLTPPISGRDWPDAHSQQTVRLHSNNPRPKRFPALRYPTYL